MSSNTNSNQERDTFTDSVVSNETTTDNDAAVNDTSDSVNPADAETSKKKKKI